MSECIIRTELVSARPFVGHVKAVITWLCLDLVLVSKPINKT